MPDVTGDRSMSGSALVYFEVNRSPSLGRCTFKPDVGGVEMSTVFTVYCFGWTDLVSCYRLLLVVNKYTVGQKTGIRFW